MPNISWKRRARSVFDRAAEGMSAFDCQSANASPTYDLDYATASRTEISAHEARQLKRESPSALWWRLGASQLRVALVPMEHVEWGMGSKLGVLEPPKFERIPNSIYASPWEIVWKDAVVWRPSHEGEMVDAPKMVALCRLFAPKVLRARALKLLASIAETSAFVPRKHTPWLDDNPFGLDTEKMPPTARGALWLLAADLALIHLPMPPSWYIAIDGLEFPVRTGQEVPSCTRVREVFSRARRDGMKRPGGLFDCPTLSPQAFELVNPLENALGRAAGAVDLLPKWSSKIPWTAFVPPFDIFRRGVQVWRAILRGAEREAPRDLVTQVKAANEVGRTRKTIERWIRNGDLRVYGTKVSVSEAQRVLGEKARR